MQLLFSLVVGVLLVAGQSLWKLTLTKSTGSSGNISVVLHNPWRVLLAPTFILGCVIYVVATVLYMYVISKYNYGVSYAMIVACSTVLALVIAATLFKESFSLTNAIGIAIIIAGIALAVKK